jgi:hypothetical protein
VLPCTLVLAGEAPDVRVGRDQRQRLQAGRTSLSELHERLAVEGDQVTGARQPLSRIGIELGHRGAHAHADGGR